MPMHTYVMHTHTHAAAQHCAGLTYGGEGHKSLDEKAGGRGELVGFLNQDIKAHLGKRKQKKRTVLQPPVGGRGQTGGRAESEGRHLPLQLPPPAPAPRLQNRSVAV